MAIKYFILAIALTLCGRLCAQPYYFRHYQVENGLSNNAVICSLQDKNGFLWFGTKDGLDRFDGYSFKVFRNQAGQAGSIGNNFIHCLYEDGSGTLWAGTENGLYKYDAATESFTLMLGTAGAPIRDVKMDRHGNLWYIWGFAVFKYNAAAKKLVNFKQNVYTESTSICISANDDVWIATTSGLLEKYNPGNDTFTAYDMFAHSKKVTANWIEKLYVTNDGLILAGTSNQGVKLFNPNTLAYKDILTYNADNTDIFVRNFVQPNDNEWWIATESGIYIYNIKTARVANLQKKYNDPYSISDNAVYSFCKDKEGGIWATTYFGGINYYPARNIVFNKWFPKTGENSLSGNVVREIHADHKGNLWIGTEDAGLNKYDVAAKKFIHYMPAQTKKSISYTNIHGMLVYGNELWAGTFEHGLDVLNINTGQVIQHFAMGNGEHDLKSNFIYCIAMLNNNNISVGTARGVFVYNRAANNFNTQPGLPVNNWYTSLLKDSAGVIWAGTYGSGILSYNAATNTTTNFRFNPQDSNSLASNRVNSIFEDNRHNLWFATEGGLCKLNHATANFTRYTTQNGLPSNFILSMLQDDESNLWVSTSKGLVCLNYTTGNTIVYTRINGILSDQFNFNSAFKDHAGNMYFGSVKGMISFNPGQLRKNTYVPPVYITGFQVFNQELVIGKKDSPLKASLTNTSQLTLSHQQSTFSIDFAALSYMAPEACEYAYKMAGLDNDWTYLKTNRKAYFTQLAPGTYTFKVKAANNSKVWNEKETVLVIKILPPWWLSMWAYIVYTIAAAGMVYYIIHSYHLRAEEKNRRKIEQLELAKEKELFDAKMEFFTNVAHEIRTPLTLIKGPMEKVIRKSDELPEIKSSLKIMERNTNRLINLTSQLLDFRQTEIKGFSLNFVKANVTEMLDEVCTEFKPLAEQKNAVLEIDIQPLPVYAYLDIDAFTKILTNLLSNAVKYSTGKVGVTLLPPGENNNQFTIVFKNDGYIIPFDMRYKIFEPFFRLKETQKQWGTGIGLALAQSLAHLHSGQIVLQQPQDGMNIFYLILPVQQSGGFRENNENKKGVLITATNND